MAGFGLSRLYPEVAGYVVRLAVMLHLKLVDPVRLTAAELLHVRIAQLVVLAEGAGYHVQAAFYLQQLFRVVFQLIVGLGHYLQTHEYGQHVGKET